MKGEGWIETSVKCQVSSVKQSVADETFTDCRRRRISWVIEHLESSVVALYGGKGAARHDPTTNSRWDGVFRQVLAHFHLEMEMASHRASNRTRWDGKTGEGG